ncbi:MAG: ABC transporter ATP-binding protein, partial [Paracoccaceae bacterium]
MELIAENLTCVRGGLPILQSVNLTLAEGSAMILRGPNGSGKTTLLRTIVG